jgi:hypothetical protein
LAAGGVAFVDAGGALAGAFVLVPVLVDPWLQPVSTPSKLVRTIRARNLFIIKAGFTKTGKWTSIIFDFF